MSAKDVVSRADLLMRRGTGYSVTSLQPEDDVPLLTDEFAAHHAAMDDVPVLTDEIPPNTPGAEQARVRLENKLSERLAAELSKAVQRRLAAELPSLIEASLALLEADLRRGILDIADDAIKDFVTQLEDSRELPAPRRSGPYKGFK